MNQKINLENNQIPLHYQLADYLLVMLEQGELNEHEKLPTEELELAEDDEIFVVKRVRFADGEPMSFTVNYVPVSSGKMIHPQHLEEMTMLESLERVVGVSLGVVQHEVEITRASQGIARSLHIQNLDPVLTVKTLVFDDKKRPV